jgi:pimeloyl-ACP methyl ester carboxylesterase
MKTLINGVETFISTGGREFDPKGKVLLFIHGSGQSHLSFVLQGRFFANRGWQVLAPDMPGHSFSGGEPLTSIEAMADWHAELLNALGVDQAIIIGHSQGGLISLEMGRRHPGRVEKIVILASALAIPVNDMLLDMAAQKEAKAMAAMVSWSHDQDGHRFDHTMPGQSHLDYGKEVMAQNKNGVLWTDLTACNNYTDGEAAAKAITCPMLCILAAKDKMVPAKFGKKLTELVQDCTCHVIADAGHFVQSEKSVETNALMRPFFGAIA